MLPELLLLVEEGLDLPLCWKRVQTRWRSLHAPAAQLLLLLLVIEPPPSQLSLRYASIEALWSLDVVHDREGWAEPWPISSSN